MAWVPVVATAVWAMLPAYVPNNAAVLAGGGSPIDGGRTWHGRRLLGDGKTWRGTAAGIAAGIAVGLALNWLRDPAAAAIGIPLPAFPPPVLLALPAGAMLGDVVGSVLKRRTGRERGAPFPGVDQLDFVAGSLALAALLAPDWFGAVFGLRVVAVVVVLTPVLHVSTNAVGYVLGFKEEPY